MNDDQEQERSSWWWQSQYHNTHQHKHSKSDTSPKGTTKSLALDTNCSRIGPTDDFFVDRKGDPKNVDYGSLHKSAIPNYKRSGAGYILGLGNGRIDNKSGDHKALVVASNCEPERRERNAFAKASRGQIREIRWTPARAANTAENWDADFLLLKHNRRKLEPTDSSQDPRSPFDNETPHYRSVRGKAEVRNHPDGKDCTDDSEASTASDQECKMIATDEMVRKERSELSRAVEDDPVNCSKWLRLIEFQDKTMKPYGVSENTQLTNAEKRSNAEIKLSIYEKAVAAVSSSTDRERLISAMMVEASLFWDGSKVQSKWKSILRDYPGSVKLWIRYLADRATIFPSFKYEDVLLEYTDSLKVLTNAYHANKSMADPHSESTTLLLVLRLTLFMQEAGFTERALASWQTLLEIQFFKPEKYRTLRNDRSERSSEELVLAFEEYWESEVPRIGDDGAQGWAVSTTGTEEPPPLRTDSVIHIDYSSDTYGSLASLERRQAQQTRQPARTIDEVTEDDPFRVVLFSDISYIIHTLPFTEQGSNFPVEAFLAFCHLPPMYDADHESIARSFNRDPFSQNNALYLTRTSVAAWNLNPVNEVAEIPDASKLAPNGVFATPIADYVVTTETLFAAKGSWFSPIDDWIPGYAHDQGPVPTNWIRRALKSLVDTGVGSDALAEYYLALELRLSPETITKTAKKLIKARPTSFRLYNAYACIDSYLGHPERATQTLAAAINTSRNMAESLQRDTLFLWQTWVWKLLGSGQEKEALERLLSYSDHSLSSDPPSHVDDVFSELHVKPAALLRTQQSLTASRDHFLSHCLPVHSSVASNLLILLSYLSSCRTLETAHSTFTRNLSLLSSRFSSTSTPHELLHQSFARLLHYHATHVPLFKPAFVREALAASIALFPQNTIFLSLYAWNESRFRINDRVRSIIADVVLNSSPSSQSNDANDSVTPHLFAIYTELNRSPTFGSNTNTIRHTFERAIATDSAGAHCASIWKLYILFERTRGDMVKAKAVWWRGVRACPWVKALWMMAFEELRSGFRDEELREVWEVMGEKELRLHTDLEGLRERMEEGLRERMEEG